MVAKGEAHFLQKLLWLAGYVESHRRPYFRRSFMKYCFVFLMTLLSHVAMAQPTDPQQEKAVELGKDALYFIRLGDYEAARRMLRQAQRMDPQALYYPMQIGYTYFMGARYRQAVNHLSHLQYHADCNPRVYVLLAQAQQADKQAKTALTTLDKGLAKFPQSGQLCLAKAFWYRDAEDWGQYEYWLNEGILLEPGFSENYIFKAAIHLKSNEPAEAAANAEMYLYTGGWLEASWASSILFKAYETAISPSFKIPDAAYQQAIKDIWLERGEPTGLDSLVQRMCLTGNSAFLVSQNASIQEKLSAYRNEVINAGHLEAYLYGLLRWGRLFAFRNWAQQELPVWKAYQDWRKAGGLDEVDFRNLPESRYYY